MRLPSGYKFKKNFLNQINLFDLDFISFKPVFGNYYLKSLQNKFIKDNQIQNVRILLKRRIKRLSFFWIRVFPWAQITKKSSFSRMGKGKGVHFKWVIPIRKGQIIFELISIFNYSLVRSLYKSFSKLGIKTKVSKVVY